MKYAHSVKLRGIVSPEEEDELKRRLTALLRRRSDERSIEEIRDDEGVSFTVDTAEDFAGNELRFVRTAFDATRNTNSVLRTLRSELSQGDRELIAGQMDRLDDDLNFHIRLDLDSFLDGVFLLTDSGDCLHLRVKVAAYPAKEERAKPVIREALGVAKE